MSFGSRNLIGTGMLEITGTRISMDGQNGDALSCIVVAIMLWIIYEIIRMFKVSDTQFKMPKIFSWYNYPVKCGSYYIGNGYILIWKRAGTSENCFSYVYACNIVFDNFYV